MPYSIDHEIMRSNMMLSDVVAESVRRSHEKPSVVYEATASLYALATLVVFASVHGAGNQVPKTRH